MTQHIYAPGDNLVFQLESGYGILRVLAVDEQADGETLWHIAVLEDFFPDIETAEAALAASDAYRMRAPHLALTNYALEKTPASRLSNTPVQASELDALKIWRADANRTFSNRSVLLMLGFR